MGAIASRKVEGSISILCCEECHKLTSYLTFIADTDMATNGLAQLSSIGSDEIVVVDMEPAEFADDTGVAIQNRVNRLMNRDDLRFVRLLRVEASSIPNGLPFQEYRKVWQPPRLIFACPKCGEGDARESRSQALSAYEQAGGKVTILASVDLRDHR